MSSWTGCTSTSDANPCNRCTNMSFETALSSNSLVRQRMAVSFGIELHDSFMDGAVEVIRAGEGAVSEMMSLQVAPENLAVVQLRSIFRQPLDREPVGALGEGRP